MPRHSDLPSMVETRRSLHRVAEHLIGGDLWRRSGRIGLRQTFDGFGQPEVFTSNSRHQLRIENEYLVATDDDAQRRTRLTTLRDAADFCGVELGAPEGVYEVLTDGDPDEPLSVDSGAAAALAEWFDLGNRALETLRSRHFERSPSITQLWPEHLDLGFHMEEVNFGVSPGDDGSETPYLYVGPWKPLDGDFWNKPFGAMLDWSGVDSVSDALTFFETGIVEATR